MRIKKVTEDFPRLCRRNKHYLNQCREMVRLKNGSDEDIKEAQEAVDFYESYKKEKLKAAQVKALVIQEEEVWS